MTTKAYAQEMIESWARWMIHGQHGNASENAINKIGLGDAGGFASAPPKGVEFPPIVGDAIRIFKEMTADSRGSANNAMRLQKIALHQELGESLKEAVEKYLDCNIRTYHRALEDFRSRI